MRRVGWGPFRMPGERKRMERLETKVAVKIEYLAAEAEAERNRIDDDDPVSSLTESQRELLRYLQAPLLGFLDEVDEGGVDFESVLEFSRRMAAARSAAPISHEPPKRGTLEEFAAQAKADDDESVEDAEPADDSGLGLVLAFADETVARRLRESVAQRNDELLEDFNRAIRALRVARRNRGAFEKGFAEEQLRIRREAARLRIRRSGAQATPGPTLAGRRKADDPADRDQ